ncbi:Protein of uncharacterised function (DUF3170) [Acinetobacter baumannii]|nr:Protein of uncharacterised function (DUF3170) [Acinetobacter baumannii]
MPLHVLGHVETQQLDIHRLGQLYGDLGFPDPGRPGEQEGTDRLAFVAQTGAAHLDRFRQRFDRLILAEYQHLQAIAQVSQHVAIAGRHGFLRDASDTRHHGFDIGHVDGFLALAGRHQPAAGARLVDHVDRLVRQMTIVDVFHRQLHRGADRLGGITHVVVRFILGLQAVDDLNGLFRRRFGDIDLLETARQSAILFEDVAELLVGGRADHPDLAARQQRFDQIGGIHLPARSRTGADDGVNFIDEQDAVLILFQLLEQRLEAFLEVAAVFGAGQQ